MNEMVVPADLAEDEGINFFGGKALALGRMIRGLLKVPVAVCLSTQAYNLFIDSTGLRGRIMLELGRKRFEDMRWEEIWDTSLRIRALFNNTPLPPHLKDSIISAIEPVFKDKAVVVRSSAIGEDSANASFAGIHESYVNVRGLESILDHIKLVWASLWSDAAMLYRKELGLKVEESSMGVIIQEMIQGKSSGVAFGINPNDHNQAVIEAVYGMNQGLVDGSIEPDRWILDRKTGSIISHYQPTRDEVVTLSWEGLTTKPLSSELAHSPPLNDQELAQVYRLSFKAESIFGSPQDVEWTFDGRDIFVLQSRPITTPPQDNDSRRVWYISLRRSFDNLKNLQRRIENELIPGMIEAAAIRKELSGLTNDCLAEEIDHRARIYQKWNKVYTEEFIPFAHGVRLFGQFYNDFMKPRDPFEFMDLLAGSDMLSLKRNEALEEMAEKLRSGSDEVLGGMINDFLEEFAGSYKGVPLVREGLLNVLLEMAHHPTKNRKADADSVANSVEAFLINFQGEKRRDVEEILELAKASYRLRDDDNIHLGRIEAELAKAEKEGLKRLGLGNGISSTEIAKALRDQHYIPQKEIASERPNKITPRQLVGQPAGPGIGSGTARVIRSGSDLYSFKSGEVIVCDAIDPNMTFIVPLASAIVERRGGMLIHGAIIAREYGIPCVTGVSDAVELIETGDTLTVDGYLGIITVSKKSPTKK
jgi:rifampicin phosphotransferase